MRATAIIPNWNGGARLRRMLESVAGMAPDRFERVLVIDNGSNDGSEALAATHGFELLRLERNFGFARAVNEGLRIAATPWVAILNNDIVLAADWLSQMAASEDHNDYLGGKLLQSSSPGKIDGGFDLISRAGTAWRAGQGTLDGPAWDKSRPAGLIPLTAALFRASIFESTGPLDERFESYLEDVDLGLRCVNHGFRGRYVPSAVVWHEGSGTLGAWSPTMVRLLSRNQVLLARKHLKPLPLWPKFVGQGLWGLLALKRGTGLAWLRGKIEGFQAKIEPVPCRQTVLDFVNESEREIAALQKDRPEWYWSAYFRLTRGHE